LLIDGRSIDDGSTVEADLCIVGAGAAGITLAREFVGRGTDVCVLESGGLEPDPAAEALSYAAAAGLPYYPLHRNRQRGLGGTTGLWAGWCRPLDDLDFERRPWVEGSGWPFGLSELNRHYERAHTICELGVYEYDPAYWAGKVGAAIVTLSDELQTRVYQLSPPTRFGRAYRAELAAARNVRVLLHAHAMEVEASDDGRRVTGVRVGCLAGPRFRVIARFCVLAAGGIENARLLLMSNRVNRAGLGNDRDLVGRYFMEHLHFPSGVMLLPDHVASSVRLYVEDQRPVTARWAFAPDVHERENLLKYAVGITANPASRPSAWLARLRRTWGRRWPRAMLAVERAWLRQTGEERWHRLYAGARGAKVFRLHHTLEQAPNRDSRITLSAERDALGLPRVQMDWRLSALDRHTAVRAREVLAGALARGRIGEVRFLPGDNDEAWPPEPLQGLRGHHMGTTRMSASPQQGVVDEHCRVHGFANLFIAGSSVFPTAGGGTPTITIIALALRLAEHLASSGLRS
jgi:choline dehydrogenase-like flavoprotein